MSDGSAFDDASFQARRWKRWQPSSFEKRAEPAGTNDDAGQPSSATRARHIADQIRQAQEALREQARREGYEAGLAQGKQDGYDEGKKTGHREGYAQGHEEGLAAGHAQGRDESMRQAAQLAAVAGSCAQALGRMEEDIAQSLVALGVRIAEHVLHSTLDVHPEKMTDMVREVVRMNGQADHAALNLHVNPADLDLVQRYLKTEPDTENWRLYANDQIERGGCVAETALGSIDATLQTRWRRTLASLGCDTDAQHDAPLQDGPGHGN
jgi:flagellar assembly protein FliH